MNFHGSSTVGSSSLESMVLVQANGTLLGIAVGIHYFFHLNTEPQIKRVSTCSRPRRHGRVFKPVLSNLNHIDSPTQHVRRAQGGGGSTDSNVFDTVLIYFALFVAKTTVKTLHVNPVKCARDCSPFLRPSTPVHRNTREGFTSEEVHEVWTSPPLNLKIINRIKQSQYFSLNINRTFKLCVVFQDPPPLKRQNSYRNTAYTRCLNPDFNTFPGEQTGQTITHMVPQKQVNILRLSDDYTVHRGRIQLKCTIYITEQTFMYWPTYEVCTVFT